MTLWRSQFVQSVGVLMLSCWIAGCATVHKPEHQPSVNPPPVQPKGVYHKVNKGETLWRIAKTYRITVEDVIQANHVPSAASIEENQLLFIPGADAVKDVIPVASVGGKDSDYWWPLKGRVASFFEERRAARVNLGIDIKGGEGDFIKASREGRVVFTDHLAGYGSTVILDHGDGFFTVYGRNDRVLVKLGDSVARGEKIAQLGVDPRGVFSHFELRKGSVPKNPLHYLPREM
jgi:lipoprotein NlpD